MFRKLISIILLVFLLYGFVQADIESAVAAYEAGDYERAFSVGNAPNKVVSSAPFFVRCAYYKCAGYGWRWSAQR